MVTVGDFSRLVSGIYEAAIAPQHWETALRELHRTLEGTAAGLLMAEGSAWSIENSTLPIQAAKSYREYYHRFDHVVGAVEHGPVGAVRTGTELMPLVRKSEFHDDWLRPLNINDVLIVRLTSEPRSPCLIVAAPQRSESFDTPERVRLMGGLVVHLQQALRTQDKIAALDHSRADLSGALDVVRHGVFIVGSGCWVLELNTAAEKVLRAADGLCLRSGRIGATSTSNEHQLHRALHVALDGGRSRIRSGQSLNCRRPSGKHAYVIHIVPLHLTETDETVCAARALVVVIDPEDQHVPAGALLRRLYGLTKGEAEVAVRVVRGASPKEIADELSVSYETIRTICNMCSTRPTRTAKANLCGRFY